MQGILLYLELVSCIIITSDMSPNPAHASNLALPTKSMAPGRFPDAFPLVACLYSAYIFNLVMLSGLIIEVDFSNAFSNDMDEYFRSITKEQENLDTWAGNTPWIPEAETNVL